MLTHEQVGIICLYVAIEDATFPAMLIGAAERTSRVRPSQVEGLQVWAQAADEIRLGLERWRAMKPIK